jgi:hypothetical protein
MLLQPAGLAQVPRYSRTGRPWQGTLTLSPSRASDVNQGYARSFFSAIQSKR